jgi:beta-glucosidase
MTLDEKIGQLLQVTGGAPDLHEAVRQGRVSSVINEVALDEVNELQRLAVHESRLGIPLLIGRDVIHGFKTIFPIPLGQAASWDPAAVKSAAAVAAAEAATAGINWTFAPMIDITRDPRWGRIAESLGEDPVLCGILGAAMVQGFQGETLDAPTSIAACAKHFAGYGAVEGGMDYSAANIPENELRNVYLRPFKDAADAGVATFMSSFSDLNGVPATGNEFLMKQVLRREWGFEGFVVSDWESIKELTAHGFTADDEMAAFEAANAGVDMEMASDLYRQYLPGLLRSGAISAAQIDTMVLNILLIKLKLGLFEQACTDPNTLPSLVNDEYLQVARDVAAKSCVLLKNDHRVLPLSRDQLESIAVIGPMADDGYEQLGTWVFDGEARHSRTCLQAIRDLAGDDLLVHWAPAMASSRSRDTDGFEAAVEAASRSDVALLFLGEESILSGEAHCRADIDLPGNQEALIEAVAATGTPVVLVVLAGRPLTLQRVVDKVAAILYAWHPGTMGGPAIADLLFGLESPSGKLPVTFPRSVGQIPMYYSKKNTGRPPTPDTITHIDDIDGKAPQTSLGMSAFYLDEGFSPLYPFGFGLSYTTFGYSDIEQSTNLLQSGETITLSAVVENTGEVAADEIVQLYIRDLVGNVTRPVRELKGFRRIRLEPGERQRVSFALPSEALAFYDRTMTLITEPGQFHAWIGGSSEADLCTGFELTTE